MKAARPKTDAVDLQRILENIADGIIVCDRDGAITQSNPAAIQIMGGGFLKASQAERQKAFFREDGKTPFPVECLPLSCALRQAKVVRERMCVLNRAEGISRFVSTVAAPLKNDAGEVIGAVASFSDITSLVHAERKINEQQALLVEATRASVLGQLSGNIAHEINTPLGAIVLALDVMSDIVQTTEINPAQLEENLKVMRSAADRITKIVKGIRAISHNQKQGEPEVSFPQRLVEETLNLCRHSLEAHGIEVRVNYGTDAESRFLCRPLQMIQAMLNLIENAAAGIASLQAKWIQIEASRRDGMLELSVAAGGFGSPESHGIATCEIFSSTEPTAEEGGLTLMVSNKVVRAHGGHLKRYRSSGAFWFALCIPLAAPEERSAA